MEKKAAPAMSLAKAYISAQFYEKATPVLQEIVAKYPTTDAAKRAKQMLIDIAKATTPAPPSSSPE